MKIFFDHCVDRRLRRLLTGYEVKTAYQMRWHEKKNGELLSLVESAFDVFLTVDQNIRYQQNLSLSPLRFIILIGHDNKYGTLAPLIPKVKKTLLSIRAGELVEIS